MSELTIPVTDDRISVEGAVSVAPAGDGDAVVFRRLDDRWRHEFPVEVDFLAESPSGVRLVFRTDSPSVSLELLATMLRRDDDPVRPSVVDLVIDGELVDTRTSSEGNVLVTTREDPTSFELIRGERATVAFDLPGSLDRRIELWMPSATVVRAHALHFAAGATVQRPVTIERRRWIHHGSSISHCMEAEGGARVWPAVASRLAGLDLVNLGLAGQCQLDQFTARTMRDLDADVISLKCGINLVNAASMSIRTFPSALHGFLDTVREGHPTTPLLVVSPILCPAHEDTPGPTGPPDERGRVTALGTELSKAYGAMTLRHARSLVRQVVDARRRAGDLHVHHLDGRELFGEDDVDDLPDGLHPNGAGYVRMGERFASLAFGPGRPLAD